MLAEKLMQDDAREVVAAVVAAAKGGDMAAAKLILDRIAPPRKGGPIRFALPEIHSVADLTTAMSGVTEALAAGYLSPEEASAVSAAVETVRRCFELTTVETRLRALEEKTR
jgi:hypothetical protein